METFIQQGNRFSIEVGTKGNPSLIRWTTWGNRDIQQSYLLLTPDGAILVDPIKPFTKTAFDVLKRYANNRFCAVVCTSFFHARDAIWFGQQFKIPLLGSERIPAKSLFRKKIDKLCADGEQLPGKIQALWSGDEQGEMWLHWQPVRGKSVLICGDTIYGQTKRGGFEGATVPSWIQEGGIRLRMNGKVSAEEMKGRYGRLRGYDFDLILNGHNPYPIENPKAALQEVLAHGKYEFGGATFMWMDQLT